MSEKKYRIGLIDEDESELQEMMRFFENDFELYRIEPFSKMEQLFHQIISENLDAVVLDYKLNVKRSGYSHNGDKILNAIDGKFQDYPCVILTQYPTDAEKHRLDEFRVIPKEFMNKKSTAGYELINKIKKQIENYHQSIKDKESQLLKLIRKQNKGKLSAPEESLAIELDDYLEGSLSKKAKIPSGWKKPESLSKLSEFLEKSDKILQELKRIKNA